MSTSESKAKQSKAKVAQAQAQPIWHPGNVSATRIPHMIRRTFMEQRALERLLVRYLPSLRPSPASAVEFGCGFGRLLPVLGDDCLGLDHITGLEREPTLVKYAKELFPETNTDIIQVDDLSQTRLKANSHTLAYAFTVLQHMSASDALSVIEEMKRVAAGFILLVEETDPSYFKPRTEGIATIGRAVGWYNAIVTLPQGVNANANANWRLVEVQKRRNEPGYKYKGKPKPYSGHYMLFAKEGTVNAPQHTDRTLRSV